MKQITFDRNAMVEGETVDSIREVAIGKKFRIVTTNWQELAAPRAIDYAGIKKGEQYMARWVSQDVYVREQTGFRLLHGRDIYPIRNDDKRPVVVLPNR